MLDSVGKISQIDSSIDAETMVYDVTAEGPCGGWQLHLSNVNDPRPEYRLETESEWFDISGQIRADIGMVSQYHILFVYLEEPDTHQTSAMVPVYTREAKVVRWHLLEDAKLVFQMDTGVGMLDGISKLRLTYQDDHGIARYQELSLSSPRLSLEAIGKWSESESFTCSFQYVMDSQVKVFSPSSEELTIYIEAPEPEHIEFDGQVFVVEGQFHPGITIMAQLWENNLFCETAQLTTEGTLQFSRQDWNQQAEFQLSFQYEQASGCSRMGRRIPVEVRVPCVKRCYFQDAFAVLEMEGMGIYESTPVSERVEEHQLYFPSETKEVFLCRKIGRAYGPKQKVTIESPGFYRYATKGRNFYYYGTRPDQWNPDQEIQIDLPELPEPISGYDGTCLKLVVETDTKISLVITKERYNISEKELREDYNSLCIALSQNQDALRQIQQIIVKHLPMTKQEFLFYHYRFTEEGSLCLVPGMCLIQQVSREWNNVFPMVQAFEDTENLGFCRYFISEKNQELNMDGLARQMEFQTPLASRIFDKTSPNATGVSMEELSAPCLGLAYPKFFAGKGPGGEQLYQGNFCLVTAHSEADLIQAFRDLKSEEEIENVSNYQLFWGHDSLWVLIQVQVDGAQRWIPLGTCLKDLLAETGAEAADLYRMANGQLCSVVQPDSDMPLLMGDQIECRSWQHFQQHHKGGVET